MTFLPTNQIIEICQFACFADAEARADLSLGYIADEPDYTSNFTSALRRMINANSRTGLIARSQVLNPRMSRSSGCDAAIVVSSQGKSKVAYFEAKWPRFSKQGHAWDSLQNGASHFTNQLNRQGRLPNSIAAFEIFYCEYLANRQPPFLDRNHSSCIWRDDALSFVSHGGVKGKIWSQDELKQLLTASRLIISDILRDLCDCRKGVPVSTSTLDGLFRDITLNERSIDVLNIQTSDDNTHG